jgi:Leucine-rich repeat (LRR) protein
MINPVAHPAVIAAFLLTSLTFIQAFTCPPDDLIAPCLCFTQPPVQVYCGGEEVTQLTLNAAMSALRAHNNLSSSDWLNLTQFTIEMSSLTHLDLTPLLGLTVNDLLIKGNPKLVSMGGPSPAADHTLIDVRVALLITFNELTDEGFGDSLKYFAPTLPALYILSNNIKGSGKSTEFLPGFSNFRQLEYLDLSSNQIEGLGAGQLANHPRLYALFLDLNPLTEIGSNAFTFEEDIHGDYVNETLYITLDRIANLNDATFNYLGNGLTNFSRPVALSLVDCGFEFISKENFEPFLNAREENFFYVGKNPLICDERMKWLHDQKDLYGFRVIEANCTNDVGYDVFTTSLIH